MKELSTTELLMIFIPIIIIILTIIIGLNYVVKNIIKSISSDNEYSYMGSDKKGDYSVYEETVRAKVIDKYATPRNDLIEFKQTGKYESIWEIEQKMRIENSKAFKRNYDENAYYNIVFRLENDKMIDLVVKKDLYMRYENNDEGMLTHKGGKFIKFEKEY